MSLLQEFGIPIPDLLYPFQKDNWIEDFGPSNLNLRTDGHFGFMGDKYSFESHMMFSRGFNEDPNTRFWLNNFGSLGGEIDANNGFTLAVHLYYSDYMLHRTEGKWNYLRDNGTLFIFKKGKQKFIVKDYPAGLVFRYRFSVRFPK